MSADLMPVKSPRRSIKLQSSKNELPQNSVIDQQFGIFSKTETVIKSAEYIGSFLVTGKGHLDRAEVVRQKLEAARAYTHSKPIVLLISLQGIKVCRDNNEHVYMAHALRRISYATCDPDHLQFAFLAREPKSQPNVQYCHAFVTNTAEEAEDLNNIVGEAFRAAYAQQRLSVLGEQLRSSVMVLPPLKTVIGPVSPELCSSSTQSAPSGQENLLTHAAQITELTNGSELRSKEPTTPSSPLRLSDSTPIMITAHASMLNKPLPPVPMAAVSQLPDTAVSRSVVNNTTESGLMPAATGDGSREHKVHKHHKHHKHRHRHRTRDNTGVSEVAVATSTSLSGDSGRHTGTSESFVDGMPPCVLDTSMNQVTGCHLTQQPPPPPPRGSSSITTSVAEEEPISNDLPALRRSFKGVNTSLKVELTTTALCGTVISSIDSSANLSVEAAQGIHITSHSTVNDKAKQPISRPCSHHSYDMADHRKCGAVITTDKDDSNLPLPLVSSCLMHTSAVTTASSSTTGCSTTTSGSTHSGSGHSLPDPRRNGDGGGAGETRSYGSGGSCPNSSRYSLSRLPLPPEVTDQANVMHHGSGSVLGALDESAELSQAPWYQPHVPREVALEILSRQPPGSFVIRDSGSHTNCYALSVRFGEGAGRCSVPSQGSGLARLDMSGPTSAVSPVTYPFAGTGISHFLIQRTARGGVRLKGLDKEWPSLACLVLHLTVMPEMLPCPLRLPKAASNPAFDADDRVDATDPGLKCAHFRPILDALPRCMVEGCGSTNEPRTSSSVMQEDEDYQRLSDFSSIMADLLPRTRTNRHATGHSRSGRGR